MTLRLTETRGSRVCPASAHASRKSVDLLGLELVERHAGVLEQERRAHQVHALLAGPDGGLACAGAPPDPVGRPGDCGWTGSMAVAGRRRRRRGRRRRLRSRRGTRCLARGRSASSSSDVAERLGAVPGRLGRAAADAELEPAAARAGRRPLRPPPCRAGSRSACRSRRCRSRSGWCVTPIAASSGNGEASCRAKWWTRTNAPSIPSSSAATASSTVWRECIAAGERRPVPRMPGPNERNPIRLVFAICTVITLLIAQAFHRYRRGRVSSKDIADPNDVGNGALVIHPELVVLGVVVVVRILLSFALEVEMDGMWPWNRWQRQTLKP